MFDIELLSTVLITEGELDLDRLDDVGDCDNTSSSSLLLLLLFVFVLAA